MQGDKMFAKNYFLASVKEKTWVDLLFIEGLDLQNEIEESQGEPIEQHTSLPLEEDPSQIGVLLPANLWNKLVAFLLENFVCSPNQLLI